MEADYKWAQDLCISDRSCCPQDLLERLMSAPECKTFGPVHHYIVGASLLTCTHNAKGEKSIEVLAEDLEKLKERSRAVSGGACARWGICGAAASCGMALAIIQDNEPLKTKGWSETQLMVANILERIAQAGAPRCCKRDSRIAVREATGWFNKLLDIELSLSENDIRCGISSKNTVCSGQCSFHPSSGEPIL